MENPKQWQDNSAEENFVWSEDILLNLPENTDKAMLFLIDFYKKHPELTPEIKQKICLNLYARVSEKIKIMRERLSPSEREARLKPRSYSDDLDRMETDLKFLAPHAGMPDREDWKDKDPFIFRENNVVELKRILESWHLIKPDYILLTETSAVPYGYAIKEAWRAAYPDEDISEFYRIESWTEQNHVVDFGEIVVDDIDSLIRKTSPNSPKLPVLQNVKEGVAKYFKNRIKKDNAKIIMFDQFDKPIEPCAWAGEWQRNGGTLFGIGRELHKAYPNTKLYYAGVGNSNKYLDFGRSAAPISKAHPRVTLKRNVLSAEKASELDSPGNRIDPLAVDTEEKIIKEILEEGYRPFGRMIKDPARRKEALQYLRDLKEFGRIVGKELNSK